MTFIFKNIIHLISVNHSLRFQWVNCYLNNIERLLSGGNMAFRFEMIMKWSLTEYSLISCNRRSIVYMDYIYLKFSFVIYNKIISIEEADFSRNWKLNRKKRPETKKGRHILAFSKKCCFVNKTTWTSWATSNTSSSNFECVHTTMELRNQ